MGGAVDTYYYGVRLDGRPSLAGMGDLKAPRRADSPSRLLLAM